MIKIFLILFFGFVSFYVGAQQQYSLFVPSVPDLVPVTPTDHYYNNGVKFTAVTDGVVTLLSIVGNAYADNYGWYFECLVVPYIAGVYGSPFWYPPSSVYSVFALNAGDSFSVCAPGANARDSTLVLTMSYSGIGVVDNPPGTDVIVTVSKEGNGNTSPIPGDYMSAPGSGFLVSAYPLSGEGISYWANSGNIIDLVVSADMSSATFTTPTSAAWIKCVFTSLAGAVGGVGDTDDDVPAIEALSVLLGGKIDATNVKLDTIIDILQSLDMPVPPNLETQASGDLLGKSFTDTAVVRADFTFLDSVVAQEFNLHQRIMPAWDDQLLSPLYNSTYTSSAPVLVLPLSSFGAGDDISFDFGGGALDSFRIYLRTFFLIFVIIWSLITIVRITRSFEL
jgi:hypothetical protein